MSGPLGGGIFFWTHTVCTSISTKLSSSLVFYNEIPVIMTKQFTQFCSEMWLFGHKISGNSSAVQSANFAAKHSILNGQSHWHPNV